MYFQLSKCTFSQQFQYRESMFFQLIGKFIWIYINLCIWKALLAYREVGRSYEEMVVYVLVAEILLLLCHSNVAVDLAEKVKTGDISINLIRPVGLKWYSFWEQMSSNLFRLLFVGLPTIVISVSLWPVCSLSTENVLLALVSTALAVLLNFYFQYIVGLLAFWFKNGTYAKMLIGGLMSIFAGQKIPLWFYPSFLVTICSFLPFKYMVYEPIAILLGEYRGGEAINVLLMQAAWILGLWILECFVWHRVQTAIEIQGG